MVLDESTSQATRVLQHVYPNRSDFSYSNLMSREKLLGSEPCIIIFSILLKIGCGDLIHLFSRLQKLDKSLPFSDFESLKALFSRMAGMRGAPLDPGDVAEAFFTEQWQFCPVKLGFADFHDHDINEIIPIHRMELISDKGGTAKLWQIEVLKEYVDVKLEEAVPTSEYTPDDDPENLGPVSRARLMSSFDCQNFAWVSRAFSMLDAPLIMTSLSDF